MWHCDRTKYGRQPRVHLCFSLSTYSLPHSHSHPTSKQGMLWFYVGKTNQYFLYRLITHDIKVSIVIIYLLTIYLIQTQTRGWEAQSINENERGMNRDLQTNGNEHEQGPTRVNQHDWAGINKRGQTGISKRTKKSMDKDEHERGRARTGADEGQPAPPSGDKGAGTNGAPNERDDHELGPVSTNGDVQR